MDTPTSKSADLYLRSEAAVSGVKREPSRAHVRERSPEGSETDGVAGGELLRRVASGLRLLLALVPELLDRLADGLPEVLDPLRRSGSGMPSRGRGRSCARARASCS